MYKYKLGDRVKIKNYPGHDNKIGTVVPNPKSLGSTCITVKLDNGVVVYPWAYEPNIGEKIQCELYEESKSNNMENYQWCLKGGDALHDLFMEERNQGIYIGDNNAHLHGDATDEYYYIKDRFWKMTEFMSEREELKRKGYKEISIAEYKSMRDGKLIGYELSNLDFLEAVRAFNPSFKDIITVDNTTLIESLKKAKVFDIWLKPVYEITFKPGDKVMALNEGGNGLPEEFTYCEVIEDTPQNDKQSSGLIREEHNNILLVKCRGYFRRVTAKGSRMRYATPEEIEKGEAFYKVIIDDREPVISKESISYGCQHFNWNTIEVLHDLLTKSGASYELKVNGISIYADTLSAMLLLKPDQQ